MRITLPDQSLTIEGLVLHDADGKPYGEFEEFKLLIPHLGSGGDMVDIEHLGPRSSWKAYFSTSHLTQLSFPVWYALMKHGNTRPYRDRSDAHKIIRRIFDYDCPLFLGTSNYCNYEYDEVRHLVGPRNTMSVPCKIPRNINASLGSSELEKVKDLIPYLRALTGDKDVNLFDFQSIMRYSQRAKFFQDNSDDKPRISTPSDVGDYPVYVSNPGGQHELRLMGSDSRNLGCHVYGGISKFSADTS